MKFRYYYVKASALADGLLKKVRTRMWRTRARFKRERAILVLLLHKSALERHIGVRTAA